MSPTNSASLARPWCVDEDALILRRLGQSRTEWFLSENGRVPFELTNDQFEFSVVYRRLIFSSWTTRGSKVWRIKSWKLSRDKITLEVSRQLGRDSATIELVPRASARAIVAGITVARQARCERLAMMGQCYASDDQQRIFSGSQLTTKIERAVLSPGLRRNQPGRYARIILRLPHERIAISGIVAESDVRNVDSLFSSTLLWFRRLRGNPKRPAITRLWIALEHNILEAARQRQVLLQNSLRERIELFEIDAGWQELTQIKPYERKNLWRKALKPLPPSPQDSFGGQLKALIDEAPKVIDVFASRQGYTLRYHGLPFARARRLMNVERWWFGIEGSRRLLLNDRNQQDWAKLLNDLRNYRTRNCRDRRHWLYRAAGEAWLESILRRDISKLDPGLIVAPLHTQFRTSHGGPSGARPIDLLALRRDGRLVVIELKVTEDREHVFQGVDYWRRVEAHRRRGHISKAKLFDEREVSDESPLVYLVAPALRFHPSFATLARMIASDIEIYRFDINEDWRGGVRVVRRERVNA